jgi:hypothetical protein
MILFLALLLPLTFVLYRLTQVFTISLTVVSLYSGGGTARCA